MIHAHILVVNMLVTGVLGAVEESPEKILIDNLLANYTPLARPVRDPTRPIPVNLSFIPFALYEIDEKLQTMTVKGILRMEWEDAFLKWDTEAHFGMERIILDQNRVWKPDIVVYNAAGSINAPVQTEENKVIVYHNGGMEWDAEGTFRVSCPVHMQAFPFDQQRCDIKISNNKYTLREVRPSLQTACMTNFTPNGQWELQGHQIYNSGEETGFKYMAFILFLKRRPAFYVMNMVIPSLGLTVLGNCLYFIPPGTSDRVAVGTTLVLAYTVFMIQVIDNTPGAFQFVPYITIFLLTAMGLSALAVIISIVVLRLSRLDNSYQYADQKAKECDGIPQPQSRHIRTVDMAFFTIHLAVFLGLCSSVIVMAFR